MNARIQSDLKAVVYLRVATREQTGNNTIAIQRATCLAKAAQMGVQVVDEFADIDVSGKALERPALRKLLNRLKHGDIAYVIAKDDARLTRSLVGWFQVVIRLNECGARFVTTAARDMGRSYWICGRGQKTTTRGGQS